MERYWIYINELLVTRIFVVELPQDTRVPNNELVLEWVHGFRGHDCRNGAMYTATGDMLFIAGSLVVR